MRCRRFLSKVIIAPRLVQSDPAAVGGISIGTGLGRTSGNTALECSPRRRRLLNNSFQRAFRVHLDMWQTGYDSNPARTVSS
jgi:hypothetical protein